MSSLTLRTRGSVNWGDRVGAKPQFGVKVIAILRQAAASRRYQRALSGRALVPGMFHVLRLTTGPRPHLAGCGPSGILVIGNTVTPHALGFPLSSRTAAYRSVGVACFCAWGSAFLFLPPFSSEEGNSLCFGDHRKH